MDNRAIGIFDSGIGGLTSLKTLRALLPEENFIFFADTGRMPYGGRSLESLRRIAVQDMDLLAAFGVKAILSAGEVVARQGPHYMVSGRRGTFIKYGEDVQEAALLAGKRPPAPDWDAEGEECWGTLYYDDGAQILEKKIPTVVSSYARYYENLYEVITAGAPALVPPEQTADVLRIIEAAQMSNAKKRRIAL